MSQKTKITYQGKTYEVPWTRTAETVVPTKKLKTEDSEIPEDGFTNFDEYFAWLVKNHKPVPIKVNP